MKGLLNRETALSQYVGIGRTRVGQFLVLTELPVETRVKLRGMPDLNEYQIRGMLAGQLLTKISDCSVS